MSSSLPSPGVSGPLTFVGQPIDSSRTDHRSESGPRLVRRPAVYHWGTSAEAWRAGIRFSVAEPSRESPPEEVPGSCSLSPLLTPDANFEVPNFSQPSTQTQSQTPESVERASPNERASPDERASLNQTVPSRPSSIGDGIKV